MPMGNCDIGDDGDVMDNVGSERIFLLVFVMRYMALKGLVFLCIC